VKQIYDLQKNVVIVAEKGSSTTRHATPGAAKLIDTHPAVAWP